MTVMPADAQRSEDGQWWWDGAQWQPVAGQAASASQPAQSSQPTQGTAAAAPSEQVGQLSDDGQWRWDGTQWQPANAGNATPASGGPQVTLGVPTAEVRIAHDGATVVMVHYTITNSGTTQIAERSLLVGIYVMAAGGTAETAAYTSGDVVSALAPGEEHQGYAPAQVDPGSWKVWIAVTDEARGEVLATSEDVPVEVAGQRAAGHDFDDTRAYSLTVKIGSVEHIDGVLFRVHYTVQSDRDVPVGLKVTGGLEAEGGGRSGQIYELTTAITAGQPHAHYLTLEGDLPNHSTARIVVDPGGPSEKEDTVVVDIAEDGAPTMQL